MTGDQIFTKRLILRKIKEEDLRQISDWSFSIAAYGDYLTPENQTFQECLSRWENNSYWNEQSKTFIIEHKERHKPIGTIRYWKKQNDHRAVLVALKIAEIDFRGQGYGTESQLGLIDFLFTNQNYHTVEMFTDIDNVPEQRCLKKLGFTFVDIQSYEDQKVARQGRLYRLTREEFELQRQGLLCMQ